jgi:O-antigen ligase
LIHRVNSLLVAGYIFLCIVLGGSAQGVWPNLALQLLGIALLAWAAISPREELSDPRRPVAIELLAMAALAVIAIQLIPLPASIWQSLPGREGIARGFAALGYPAPSLPISETPYQSVATLFYAIPALAALFATDKLRPSPRVVAGAVIAGLVSAVILGVIQVGGGPNSWAYLYPITNPGAVGFFANRNHMATLLLVGIPLAAALFASAKSDRRSVAGKKAVAAALFLIIFLGLILNGSIAGYGLVLPVALASAALVPAGTIWRRFALPLAGIALVGGIVVLAMNPIAAGEADSGANQSLSSRVEIWKTTSDAIAQTFPVGTGLGSFEQIYRQHEEPAKITRFFVNHAHNDYLEIVLELGVAGAILILMFLAWWAVATIRIWKSPLGTPYARAATVATAVVLAHSIVDFPLRTAAISAIFATCLGLMTLHLRNPAPEAKAGELRPSRHVKLG